MQYNNTLWYHESCKQYKLSLKKKKRRRSKVKEKILNILWMGGAFA